MTVEPPPTAAQAKQWSAKQWSAFIGQVSPAPDVRKGRRTIPGRDGRVLAVVAWEVHGDGTADVSIDLRHDPLIVAGTVRPDGRITEYRLVAREKDGAVDAAALRRAGDIDALRALATAARSGERATRLFPAGPPADHRVPEAATARDDLTEVLRSAARYSAARKASPRPEVGRRRRGQAHDDLVREVAGLYRQQVGLGDRAPVLSVAAAVKYEVGYVRKLVVEARRKGLLPPAPGPGRAGLATPDMPSRSPRRKGSTDGSTK